MNVEAKSKSADKELARFLVKVALPKWGGIYLAALLLIHFAAFDFDLSRFATPEGLDALRKSLAGAAVWSLCVGWLLWKQRDSKP